MSNITPAKSSTRLRLTRAPFGSKLRGALRLAVYLSFTLLLMPVQAALLLFRSSWAASFPVWYHRQCCRWLGFHIHVIGTPSRSRPTLFAVNHSSYLDIEILASIMPVSFIAKAEVAKWPLFGQLAKLQQTVFIDRKRHTTHKQRDDVAARLAKGDNLILFPEGTSDDGNRIKPFRSALFSVAEGEDRKDLVVQPVSLTYVEINGLPMGRVFRPLLAWYGEMTLFGHLWRFACLGPVSVVLEFHPQTRLSDQGSRKELAKYCEIQVAEGISRALRGEYLRLSTAPKILG